MVLLAYFQTFIKSFVRLTRNLIYTLKAADLLSKVANINAIALSKHKDKH